MYMASLDIKMAFDEAKPKRVAKIMDSQNTQPAIFECVESRFAFNRCLRQVSVEAPRLWQKMATQIWATVEDE